MLLCSQRASRYPTTYSEPHRQHLTTNKILFESALQIASFYIVHKTDTGNWTIRTDYSAYGDKSIDWIDKYATDWEIDLSAYYGQEN